MAALKIQVLGRGLIPRGYGIAPRKAPFYADLTLIQTILNTPGLKVRMVNPTNGQFINVTRGTLQRLWDKYSGMDPRNTKDSVKSDSPNNTPIKPVTPQQPIVPPVTITPPSVQQEMVKDAVGAATAAVFGEDKKEEEPNQEEPKPEEEKKLTFKPTGDMTGKDNKHKK